MKRLVLLTCAAIYSIVLAGATSGRHRDISFTHISINDGLSQSTVRSACQDSRGQMWFATHDGLNRFDGYDFTVYRHRDDDSTSIADNIIKADCGSALKRDCHSMTGTRTHSETSPQEER